MKFKIYAMTIKEKISALREIMDRENIDAYIISGTDPHNSEYLPAAWRQREWISGFTGSFGTVVITRNDAGLWTDTRYFIQAKKQLADSGITMHKLRVPEAVDFPEWLAINLPEGAKIGVDGFCTMTGDILKWREILAQRNITVIEKIDLLGEIWLDRPALPESPIFLVSPEVSGFSSKEKINFIREFLTENNADYFLFSCLDEIAWLYNIRCNDVPYNPIAISYAIVGKEKAYLFLRQTKVLPEIEKELSLEGVEIRDYHHLFLFLDEIDKTKRFCVDPNTLNFAVYNKINSKYPILAKISPVILKKAIKNETEIEGFRKACVKDGIAMTKFFYWIESNISNHSISETEASDKLTALRAENEGYVSDSFSNISAYGENAALPHYSAIRGKDSLLKPRGLYLVDSGGHYRHGTTDITRTIPLGELTYQEKEDYTLVLKGMIALSRCIFPKGTKGCNIDIVARQSLWHKMMNFGHGTGHGVGHFLNVHEGPQSIRQDLKDQDILPGMVTSNEPGLYREGSHGIRHENLIVCKNIGVNEFGEWHGFETLTLCYFDTSALLPELLDNEEKAWLNAYHRLVYEKLSSCLPAGEANWLEHKTKAI